MKLKTKHVLIALALTIFSIGASAAEPPEKEWTFLLFLNGHNNLSTYGTRNLKDMEKSGSTDKLNIVVEWGSEETNITKRMLVKRSTNPEAVTSPVVMSLPDHDMGDYKNLVEFVKWGVKNYPAKHYFVAVWNHGSGWHFQDMSLQSLNRNTTDFQMNDISFDDSSGNHITTEQLGLAMGEIKSYLGRNIDIYGSDACLMQMVEVAGEMKDSVNYFVGSEDTEPGEGWPYESFFKIWATNPTMTPAQVSTVLSREYVHAYNGGVYDRQEVTFSALDLSKFDALLASTKNLVTHITSLGKDSLNKIRLAIGSVQGFYFADSKDYGDLVKVIGALPIQKNKKMFSQVSADIKSLVIAKYATTAYSKARGVAIWMPGYNSSYMERYKGLNFDKSTGWSSLISSVVTE
ncbi:MAG: hypothetical protein H7061_13940 [Bdellovibrionaceae bacterium]|nr:hypothetical protein [Bdellovibrio sp.]